MHTFEARIPPPLVMLIAAAFAWLVVGGGPVLRVADPGTATAAMLAFGIGLTLNVLPKLAFRKVGTTVNPLHPDRVAVLVTSGIHAHTRNPMYLGHLLMLFAWALWLRDPAALAGMVIYWLWVTRFQILPEERALASRFGQAYLSYRSTVRRWI